MNPKNDAEMKKQEQSEELMNEWWICNIIHKIKTYTKIFNYVDW